ATCAHTIHGNYKRLPDPVLLGSEEESRILLVEWILRTEARVPSVDTCTEGTIAISLQHDHVDVVVPLDPTPSRSEVCEHVLVERIEPLGTIERDRRDLLRDLQRDRPKFTIRL